MRQKVVKFYFQLAMDSYYVEWLAQNGSHFIEWKLF